MPGDSLEGWVLTQEARGDTLAVYRGGTPMKVIDPVCKMEIDSNQAAAKSEYQGKTIYFCAPGCKAAFDKDPAKYVVK
jgi:YHS domain-containing protein